MKVLPVHVEAEARQGDLKTPDVSCERPTWSFCMMQSRDDAMKNPKVSE